MMDENSTSSPPFPINPPITKCNYYVKNNQSNYLTFGNPYGGIPQNLAFNGIGYLILMIMFTILRRLAGNYGRLALVRKDDQDSKWTQVFFAPEDSNDPPSSSSSLGGGGVEEEEVNDPDIRDSIMASSLDYNEMDRGYFSWVSTIFTLSDDKYLRKCGSDAVQYLKFQRHLITFVAIMTLTCIVIILPINFQGELQGSRADFGHTTISNLSGESHFLWVHVILGILFLPLGIFIMRRFSVDLGIEEESSRCISSRTLMIACIPRSYCTKEFLKRHFQDTYSSEEFEIEDITIAHDVARLTDIDNQRDKAYKAKTYCEHHMEKTDTRLKMTPYHCGVICCCCQLKSVDALEFYRTEEGFLTDSVHRERAKAKSRSIGIAFITFSNLENAQKVRNDYRRYFYGLFGMSGGRPKSSLEKELKPWKWHVRFAPPPEDIYWENLDYYTHRFFLLKAFLVNIILFLILFFFTSPVYILSELELFINMKKIAETLHLPEKINDFIPTLILWTLSAMLPIIVAYSDWWMGHWRRSIENLWIMRKVFFYLLFMVLILPSIGLTSLKAFFENFIKNNENINSINWNCIFLPDNGAFFVNYVITSALVGTGLEFMRFSELFVYTCRMIWSRSIAETPSVRKANVYEFPFGFNYGWMLLIFALTSAYCVICPLVTPFSLFYFLMKHLVDRYNIYYAYKRSKINKNIHATAVNFVIVALLIQQLILLFFNIVRSGSTNGILTSRAIFSITMFTICSFLFLIQIFFHLFKGISPIQYVNTSSSSSPFTSSNNSSPRGDNLDIFEVGGATSRFNRKLRKSFVPNVLKDSDQVTSPSGPHNSIVITTSESVPTFDNEEIIEQESPKYGSTTQRKKDDDSVQYRTA